MARTFREEAEHYIEDLGGKANIANLVNCATRIRAEVRDISAIAPMCEFLNEGAINVTFHGNMVQIIVGLDVPQVLEEMRHIIDKSQPGDDTDEYGLTPEAERAKILMECLGLPENVQSVTVLNGAVMIQVADIDWVDPFDIMLQLDIGITSVDKRGNRVYVYMDDATSIAKELNVIVHRLRHQ